MLTRAITGDPGWCQLMTLEAEDTLNSPERGLGRKEKGNNQRYKKYLGVDIKSGVMGEHSIQSYSVNIK